MGLATLRGVAPAGLQGSDALHLGTSRALVDASDEVKPGHAYTPQSLRLPSRIVSTQGPVTEIPVHTRCSHMTRRVELAMVAVDL